MATRSSAEQTMCGLPMPHQKVNCPMRASDRSCILAWCKQRQRRWCKLKQGHSQHFIPRQCPPRWYMPNTSKASSSSLEQMNKVGFAARCASLHCHRKRKPAKTILAWVRQKSGNSPATSLHFLVDTKGTSTYDWQPPTKATTHKHDGAIGWCPWCLDELHQWCFTIHNLWCHKLQFNKAYSVSMILAFSSLKNTCFCHGRYTYNHGTTTSQYRLTSFSYFKCP